MPQFLNEENRDFDEPVENLIAEDDKHIGNLFSTKHQRLLTEILYSSWKPLPDEKRAAEPRSFFADSNIGVFFSVHEPPLVPDVFISLDVTAPPDLYSKSGRSYLLWEYGKVPEVVVEIVSNKEGGKLTHKLKTYARKGIHYYIVFDPLRLLSEDKLRVYEPGLLNHFRRREDFILPDVGLGLTLWHGEFEGATAEWLRWTDNDGKLLLTGIERAAQLSEKLRELGVDVN